MRGRTRRRRSTASSSRPRPAGRAAGVDHRHGHGLIAQGSKRLAIGDRVYDYGPGQYLVASVDLPITGHYTHASADEPALGFGLVLRPSAIASLLLDTRRPAAAPAPPGLGVADASPELLDAVVRMLRLLDRPGDRDVLAPMIEREILWRLLIGPLGESVRQIGLADSTYARQPRRPLDHRALQRAVPRRGPRSLLRHEHVRVPPQLPRRHGAQPDPVPEADPPAEVAPAAAHRRRTTSPPSATGSATTARRSSAASTGGSSGSRLGATRLGSAPAQKRADSASTESRRFCSARDLTASCDGVDVAAKTNGAAKHPVTRSPSPGRLRSGGSVRAVMRRNTTVLWTLVAFFAGTLVFGSLRRATEDSSTGVVVLVQLGALAVIIGVVVLVVRRLR